MNPTRYSETDGVGDERGLSRRDNPAHILAGAPDQPPVGEDQVGKEAFQITRQDEVRAPCRGR